MKYALLLTVICSFSYSQTKDEFVKKIKESGEKNNGRKSYRLSKKMHKKYPTDTMAIYYHAFFLEALKPEKNKQKILELYDNIIQVDSTKSHSYNLKSLYLLRSENFEMGITTAKKGLSKKKNAETYRILGLLYEAKEDTVSANSSFADALSLDVNYSFLNFTIANTMFNRGNYFRAVDYYIKYIELLNKKKEFNSYAFVPALIISLWQINEKEKATYYWKTYSKGNEAHYNYLFSTNEMKREIKKYCEGN